MRCELPEFARCCFCFPLRFGLLAWAYMKLGFSLLLTFHFISLLIFEHVGFVFQVSILDITFTIVIIFIFVDIAFLIMLIVSAHKKEYKKMKWFYKEAIFGLVLYILLLFYSIGILFHEIPLSNEHIHLLRWFILTIWSIFFWIMISQAYLIILVRSEFRKLERRTDVEFTNNAAEAVATAVSTNDIVA